MVDAVESKVFGIGAESYTVGSHEFYMCYAMSRPNVLVTFDTGHFHPTEVVSAKLSSMLTFKDKLLLHVSRPCVGTLTTWSPSTTRPAPSWTKSSA